MEKYQREQYEQNVNSDRNQLNQFRVCYLGYCVLEEAGVLEKTELDSRDLSPSSKPQ